MSWATLADLEARRPAELIILAADESTGLRDDARIEASIADATAEMRAILKGRYSSAELARLDDESRDTLRVYAMDITLYRISVDFGRQTETNAARYATAIKRLEGIVAGKGALTFVNADSDGSTAQSGSSVSPNEAIMDAPERMFTRDRLRGM